MESDQDKIALGKQAMGEFFGQFGNDIYAKILLEVLFEELYGVGPEDKRVEEK